MENAGLKQIGTNHGVTRTIARLAQALSLLWLASSVPAPIGRGDFESAKLPDQAEPVTDPRIKAANGESA